ncbi:Asp23/Gls24 family envelope stress response protein [Caviibacter abscessus]|uniref:Asp23/Gls24 family envelope stress response protein n=1 Tax=Caviibacter abscessus TaxID=1766719 RepID=UPI000833F1E1|nr:Asp23/Gls24 family envelope stress response protein [Caviibacter abscessus]
MEFLGNIIISPNVIKDIVIETLKEIENVKGISTQTGKNEIVSFLKGTDKRNLEVEMGETECVVDLSIAVAYGCEIRKVAEVVQRQVAEKIKEFTEINVREINVTIEQVVKEREE